MSKFKVGDVVVLNSGGPKMTIRDVKTKKSFSNSSSQETEYEVVWFDEKKEERYASFTESVLKLSE